MAITWVNVGMIEAGLDAAVDLIVSGPGSTPLLHFLSAARVFTRAPIAYLVVLRNDQVQLVASEGVSLIPFGSIARVEPGTDIIFDQPMLVQDLTEHPVLCVSPLVTRKGGWRWFAATPVPLPMLQHRVALCCADPRVGVERPGGIAANLHSVVLGVADTLTLLSVIGEQRNALAEQAANRQRCEEEHVAFVGKDAHLAAIEQFVEPAGVTMRFLLSTLIGQRRMLERSNIAYHALARWRAAIKPWQIDALRALKAEPPAGLIDCVANELATAAVDFHGRGSVDVVVPVACGNSGEMCLAYQLAEAVAARLGVAFVSAFDRIETTGSSHPRRNGTRPGMKLRHAPTQRVLLIDDVATSGAHIAEATKLLRQSAAAVLPLVWIGAR